MLPMPDGVVVAAGQQRLAGRARTAPWCGTGCTGARRPRGARRSACGTARRRRSTRRSRRRRAGSRARSARPPAAAAARSAGTTSPGPWRRRWSARSAGRSGIGSIVRACRSGVVLIDSSVHGGATVLSTPPQPCTRHQPHRVIRTPAAGSRLRAMSGCCGPGRPGTSGAIRWPHRDPSLAAPGRRTSIADLADDPGRHVHDGHRRSRPATRPTARVRPTRWSSRPSRSATRTVTNDQFAAFVAATGHRTSAEEFGASFVFGGLLPDDFPPTRGVAATPVVARGRGRRLAAPRGPAERHRRPRRPSRGARQLARRHGVLRVERHPPAHRGRVGAGRSRRARGLATSRGATSASRAASTG